MASTNYTMWSWASSRAPSGHDLTTLLSQTSSLVRETQNAPSIDKKMIVLPCNDPKHIAIEVAIFFPTSYAQQGKFSRDMGRELLNNKAHDLHFDYGDFVVQPTEHSREFSHEELQRVFGMAASSADWVVKEAKDAARNVPDGQISSLFRIARWRLDLLKKASGDDLQVQMESLLKGIQIDELAKTPWETILLVVSGIVLIVTKGQAIWSTLRMGSVLVGLAFAAIEAEFVTVGELLVEFLPWAIAAAVVIGVAGTAAVLALKGAANVLFVVNDTDSRIIAKDEHFPNGERTTMTPQVEARVVGGAGTDDYIAVGLYVYSKTTAFGFSIGFFGSLVGISYTLTGLKGSPCFSVGMDCPNSVFGGTNSIKLLLGDDPSGVAGQAMDCHDEEGQGQISGADVSIMTRRAARLGSINWGICVVTEKKRSSKEERLEEELRDILEKSTWGHSNRLVWT
ncbi:hypothetical protein F4805DRAFT_185415 [Annulohypoxylon moriforme]|nr:hypothetical protein F4805DRAFT_185415 [Annulohypoxylon moriforme]